jgi:hypothetical protein
VPRPIRVDAASVGGVNANIRDHMLAPRSSSLLLLAAAAWAMGGALCSSTPSTPPSEPLAANDEERAIQKLARQLRATGVTVDTAKLEVERKHRDAAVPDLGAQLELGLRPQHVEVLWQLRAILETTPPFRSVTSLREQAVAARLPEVRVYYAADRRAMVFVDAEQQDPPSLEAALAGGLVHAFYDQAPGGLAELLYEPQGLLDGIRVRKCLLEGHARLAELYARRSTLDRLDAQALAALDPEPRHLHATLADVPCGCGAVYLHERYEQGGWGAVLRAVRTPLPSTEQLLHRAKVDQDFPVNVALPAWPEDEYDAPDPLGTAKVVHEDVLGEQTIHRLLLERGDEPDQAFLAAVGWDGDRLRIYEHESGERVVVWRSVWDRELDAEQFAAAIAPKGIEPRAFRVERHGRVIDAVSTPGPEMATRLHAALSARVSEPAAQPSDAASTAAIEARNR